MLERKLNCFDKLKFKLDKFEFGRVKSLINDLNHRIENMIGDDIENIVEIKSYCVCPYKSHRVFGFKYYYIRDIVSGLVDEFGLRLIRG